MKKLIRSTDDFNEDEIFSMSKLSKKHADESLVGDIGDFIYFSPVLDSHGTRIKFAGGSKETNRTRTAPSLMFNIEGDSEVILQPWMNKDNCPNGFDDQYIRPIQSFIKKFVPILLLVWFERLDESDALAYFEGRTALPSLLQETIDCPERISECKTLDQLHRFCKENRLYEFE